MTLIKMFNHFWEVLYEDVYKDLISNKEIAQIKSIWNEYNLPRRKFVLFLSQFFRKLKIELIANY